MPFSFVNLKLPVKDYCNDIDGGATQRLCLSNETGDFDVQIDVLFDLLKRLPDLDFATRPNDIAAYYPLYIRVCMYL